ncbi:DMT family transporter [Nocardia vinacea]|uniref:DMT family transporter n=1 Tax=Nocardia vinacea TaxID=96468 RepID=A0ABZ1Z327_9NOCA|nr:DMT family transporter [Nocardia vinacea]
MSQVGPATAAAAMFLVPAFGLSCAWMLLGESISLTQVLGAALMFVGAWLNSRSNAPRETTPAPEPVDMRS